MNQPRSQNAFTLIEMLVVIAIIAILAGLLFPAIRGAITKGKVAQANADVRAIEAAIRQYYTEYGKLPVTDADQGVSDKFYGPSSGTDKMRDIIDVLRANATGVNANNVLNPRRIVFYEPPSRKGAVGDSNDRSIYDPWGEPYRIKLDNNYDGQIEYYSSSCGGDQRTVAVVISFGPNKNQDNPCTSGSDEIVSFR